MRPLFVLSVVLLATVTPVCAQVTLDLRALDVLPDHPGASHTRRSELRVIPAAPKVATRQAPAAAPATSSPTPATQAAPATQATPATQAAPATQATPPTKAAQAGPATPATPPAQPALPENVPKVATIEPIAPPEPPAGSPPPPAPSISDKAATSAAPTTSGLRLTFEAGQSDLSPESAASIKQLAQTTPRGDTTTFNVSAYSGGKPDDPSTARRVSLSRAMAVRSALVADGVPSARIFVRALGEQAGDGPADRADISVTGVTASADTAPATTATSR